jgi:predicted CopG family antitoxin
LEAKKRGESFSETIEKLLERGGDLMPLWGILSDSKHWAEIENSANEIRRRTLTRPR